MQRCRMQHKIPESSTAIAPVRLVGEQMVVHDDCVSANAEAHELHLGKLRWVALIGAIGGMRISDAPRTAYPFRELRVLWLLENHGAIGFGAVRHLIVNDAARMQCPGVISGQSIIGARSVRTQRECPPSDGSARRVCRRMILEDVPRVRSGSSGTVETLRSGRSYLGERRRILSFRHRI